MFNITPAQFQHLLDAYLLPFAIAVPLAIGVLYIMLRRDDELPPPPKLRPPPAPPRVLVVDDSAVVRAKLRKLLEGAGYQVELAEDGEQAQERLAAGRYALLITDLEMPKVDGFQLIAAVQGALETEDLPIIAITGHEELQARVHDMEGLFGLFRKPWNDRELLKRVATVAGLQPARVPARAAGA